MASGTSSDPAPVCREPDASTKSHTSAPALLKGNVIQSNVCRYLPNASVETPSRTRFKHIRIFSTPKATICTRKIIALCQSNESNVRRKEDVAAEEMLIEVKNVMGNEKLLSSFQSRHDDDWE